MQNPSPAPDRSAPNAYWLLGHCFPVVLDENGCPHYYATNCAYCGVHIADLRDKRQVCQKVPK